MHISLNLESNMLWGWNAKTAKECRNMFWGWDAKTAKRCQISRYTYWLDLYVFFFFKKKEKNLI